MEEKKVYTPMEVTLDKREGDAYTSVLINDRTRFGAYTILVEEDKKSEIKFEKKDAKKEFNLLFGEVEVLEGTYFTNKNKKRHFDLRGEEKPQLLIKVPVTKEEHLKLDLKIIKTFKANSITFEILDGKVEGFRFIVVDKGYKFDKKKAAKLVK